VRVHIQIYVCVYLYVCVNVFACVWMRVDGGMRGRSVSDVMARPAHAIADAVPHPQLLSVIEGHATVARHARERQVHVVERW
jgi:hypothetical protein